MVYQTVLALAVAIVLVFLVLYQLDVPDAPHGKVYEDLVENLTRIQNRMTFEPVIPKMYGVPRDLNQIYWNGLFIAAMNISQGYRPDRNLPPGVFSVLGAHGEIVAEKYIALARNYNGRVCSSRQSALEEFKRSLSMLPLCA